ncbi:transcription-repair coupling factor [Gallaecimonas kandeliae]|uniref:transcription-repair coupling factor n=1 Tax=Gallaecimonas kandeliae TaxID=3029055 RepID=UPI0026491E25|nr:transcription-repair coupling factor [Gallaecimonas kandeliae]WKE67039.1 transcription-repair coupling factor [Gallaecimonas kandeliae]
MKALELLELPSKGGDRQHWINLAGDAQILAIMEACHRHGGFNLLVTSDSPTANRLVEALSSLMEGVQLFPDWETLPFDTFSPHQDIISERLTALYQLPYKTGGLMVLPVTTLLGRLAPRGYVDGATLLLKKGEVRPLERLRDQLAGAGYRLVDQVMEHGEFAVRGGLIDLYPMGESSPYRVDFFDDEIETLRRFDPESQRSTGEVEEIRLLPGHEFPMTAAGIERFRKNYRHRFDAPTAPESLYQQVSKGQQVPGIEYYLPLFFDDTASLFDYLPAGTQLLSVGDLESAMAAFWRDLEYRFEERRHDRLRPILAPRELFVETGDCFAALNQYPRLALHQGGEVEGKGGVQDAGALPLPELAIDAKGEQPLKKLLDWLAQDPEPALFVAESEGRREALLALLGKAGLHPARIKRLADWLAAPQAQHGVLVAPLEAGCVARYQGQGLKLVPEAALTGPRVVQRKKRKKEDGINTDAIIRSLAELSIGQPVVHREHGVGRYQGLTTLGAGGIDTEYLMLEYAKGDKLYVPVASLHLISRYAGSEEAPLHRLGGEAWEKARRKAAEKVRDVAAELLDVYARREAKPGFAFALDQDGYRAFCDAFPFEETDDQLDAIEAVVRDMTAKRAMDRLVCGDVGFGKTEVAMRAAYIAVSNNRQVAVLVPTTLLAQQHFENFRDRFAEVPVRIEAISRFQSPAEQKAILKDAAEGKVDILIGTHKLLQKDVKFDDLGLLIVDEEHRFGVRQKEQVKKLRAEVDILTLTATPIPRTLNMAMSGMRDLSVIATAPARRLAIKTFVREFDKALVREAVLREIRRGGQVYYLHNEVESIEDTAKMLEELIPEARVSVAHGQMRERELEKVMADFYHQRHNLLVCTTIIETGIDVPTANTIIMDRADSLGLAQLHQLRGRVGRSHHQAYAYLMTPHPKRMTKDAVKRLEAIASLEALGAGFLLATQDLEIRGAGELLGEDQSGQIAAIGFDLYMDMLDEAVEALKAGKEPSLTGVLASQCEVDLRLPALLPHDYIPDVGTRLQLYKRIASAKDVEELRELNIELIDRFGLLPDAAKQLFKTTEIRLLANPLGLTRVEASSQGISLDFSEQTKVDPGYLIGLLQQKPSLYRLEGPTRFKVLKQLDQPAKRLDEVQQLLEELARNAKAA